MDFLENTQGDIVKAEIYFIEQNQSKSLIASRTGHIIRIGGEEDKLENFLRSARSIESYLRSRNNLQVDMPAAAL